MTKFKNPLFAVVLFGAALYFALSAQAATPADFGLQEGAMISASGSQDPDIYIINAQGYKRLFLNPVIFNFYGHLGGWGNVQSVNSSVRDAFPTTTLFQNCETNDPKVYAVEVTGEDTGTVHHVNISGDAAVQQDPNFFKKVFCINNTEFSWYTQSSVAYTSVSQIPPYSRGGTPSPSPTASPVPSGSPTTPPPPAPTPSPTVTLSGNGGGSGSTITFTAQLQDVPRCFSYTWFFGDNMAETTTNACYTAAPTFTGTLTKQHTYAGNGTYNAYINVGGTLSNTVIVTVSGQAPTPAPTPQVRFINMQDFNFSPPTLNLNQGDTIRFTNLDSAQHSAVADGGAWSTPVLNQNQSSDIGTSGLSKGTHSYHCGVHGFFMTGRIIVE